MNKKTMVFQRVTNYNIMFIISILFTKILFYSYFNSKDHWIIVIKDQETNIEYMNNVIGSDDILTFEWIHSVEKTYWQEKIQITDDGKIMLIETSFESYGSGVPFQKEGKVKVKNGYITISNLKEIKEVYRWIHSQKANFTIYKNDEILLNPDDIPHHHKVELIVKKG